LIVELLGALPSWQWGQFYGYQAFGSLENIVALSPKGAKVKNWDERVVFGFYCFAKRRAAIPFSLPMVSR
jgi:hypothetical protein